MTVTNWSTYFGGGITVQDAALYPLEELARNFITSSGIEIHAQAFCSVYDLVGLSGTSDGQCVFVASYYDSLSYLPGQSGGGLFVWKDSLAKSNHNGVNIISPTVPWTGTQATLSAFHAKTGETDPSGNGCWVRQTDRLYVRMAGAIGDGSSDDLTALTAALAASDAVYLGDGTFKITGNLNLSGGQRIIGAGQSYSKILVSGDGYDAFTLSSDYASIEGVRIYASARRASGNYVTLSSATFGNKITDFEMQNCFKGISITANARITYIERGRIVGIKETTGVGIEIAGGGDTFLNNIVMDTNGSQPKAGINIKDTNALWLSDIDIIHAGIPILIDPDGAQSQGVSAVFASQVACDTSDGAGIKITPTGNALVKRMFFSDGWCASCDLGVHIVTEAGSTVDSPQFDNYKFYGNNKQGFYADNTNSGISGIAIKNSYAAGNSASSSGTYSGIDIGNNISGFSVIGTRSGTHNQFSTTQKYGILIGTGCNNYTVTDNNVSTNVTAGILDNSKSTSTVRTVANNTGHLTDKRGTATITAGNTSVTVTHGIAAVPDTASATPMADLAGTSYWVTAPGATTFTINIGAAAGADKQFSWQARAY